MEYFYVIPACYLVRGGNVDVGSILNGAIFIYPESACSKVTCSNFNKAFIIICFFNLQINETLNLGLYFVHYPREG